MDNRGIWGLSQATIEELGEELLSFHQEFASCFRTKTREVSEHGLTGLKGSLLLETKRTYTGVSRKIVDPLSDGQNYQHVLSDSPWESDGIFREIQRQICEMPNLSGGMLNIDDSGDECSSTNKAGAQRQYLGRIGKVELGQVGVVASYYQNGVWALVDAELFLPESWFTDEKRQEWKRLHIPGNREFASKLDIAAARIDSAVEQGVPFTVVGADTWYGRDGDFRDRVAAHGKVYMASIPCNQEVYLEEPQIGIPEKAAGQRGPACKHERVLDTGSAMKVRDLAKQVDFEPIDVRECERGVLRYEHAFVEVWTLREEQREDAEGHTYNGLRAVKELLIIRKDTPHKKSYSLSNAPVSTDKETLAQWKADRYFVERTIQDAKTGAGWDDLASGKYRSYMHTLAIDALAIWFVTRMKLKLREQQADISVVSEVLGVRRLPEISYANIRELLLTVFPLKTLTKEQAVELVTKHLVGRTKSTRSRLKGTKMLI